MIEFVFGKESARRTEYVIEKMRVALSENKKCILIIPEQQALFWDRIAASHFEPTDAFNIESVSFKRLANNVFRKFGGVSRHFVNEGEKALYMWSAVHAMEPSLSAFGSVERLERCIPQLIAGTNELRLYGIDPETLMEASKKLSNIQSSLPSRLSDLALISSAYNTIMSDEVRDPGDLPDILCKTLEENDYFSDTCVFIDSFYSLTPKEIKIVDKIFSQTSDVLITFAMDTEDAGAPHMEYVFGYMKEMARIAARRGLDIKKTAVADRRKSEFSYLSKNLWDYGAAPINIETDRVSIVKCSDRYDEAALAAARIKELVANGASFSDIACVSADFEKNRGITDIELEKEGIPVYVSGKTPVTSSSAVRLVNTALSVISGGWKRESIISVARTGLCSLSSDEIDALELYSDIWKIGSKSKFTGPDWTMNAEGYTENRSRRGDVILSLANSAKNKLIPPVLEFSKAFPGKISDICQSIYKLLCDFSVYEQLVSQSGALENAGKLAEAQKKAQVWDAICGVLDTLVRALPDEEVSAKRFTTLFRYTTDSFLIGTIPDGVDRVSLGSVGEVRLDSVKHLIVLGAKSGEFPRVVTDSGFFNNTDRAVMRSVGLEISPDTMSKQREEMFRFSETVSAPSETLTVFVPSDKGENRPSMGTARIMKLLPKAKVYDFSTPEAERTVRLRGRTAEDFKEAPLSANKDKTTGAALTRLFDKDIKLTQTRIECFNSCPFKYYCEHILRLEDVGAAELSPADVGTFIHYVLENFMRAAKDKQFPLSREFVASEAERRIASYKARVIPEGADGHVEYMFERLSKSIMLFANALNDEFAQSRFAPCSFELKVGFSDDLPAVPISLSNGHNLTVRGIVDRMDILREDGKVYVRVVDYKTGSKKFSLDKVMKGENIQLLLYLFALCNMPKDCSFAKELAPDGERIVPAGAVYFSARPGEGASSSLLSEREAREAAEKAISRTGIVLGDSGIIEAMDSELKGRFAPAYLNDKGVLKGSFAESEEDFKKIKTALDGILKDVGERMIGGEAAASPKGYGPNSACTYCAMKPVCRHSDNEKGGEADE